MRREKDPGKRERGHVFFAKVAPGDQTSQCNVIRSS